jgi:hypothetical protein
MLRALILLLAVGAVGCPAGDDDDDTVTPPGDDDDSFTRNDCEEDVDCRFTSGLEICEEGSCVEGDRNNSLAEAQLLAYDGAANLHIAPAGDVDWFRFNGTAGDLVRIRAMAEDTNVLDTVVRFYDAQGTELAFNDDFDRVGGIAPDAWLFTGVGATGPWYFSVEDVRSWVGDPSDPPEGGEDFAYDVDIVRAGAGAGAAMEVAAGEIDGPGDAYAWEIPEYRINYNLGGFLESAGDHDWLEIPVVRGAILRLYGFPNSGSAGVTRLRVYLPDGLTPITTIDGPGWSDDRRLWIPVLEDGSYFVEVSDAGGGGGYDHWYWLHGARNEPPELEDPPGPPIDVETEPNDGASPEDSGLHLTGPGSDSTQRWARINPPGDEDWYAVEAEAGDRLTVSCARTEAAGEATRLHIELRDPAGDVRAAGDWAGEEEAVLALQALDAAGTWHVVVTEQDPGAGSGGRYYGLTLAALRP